MKTKQIMDEIYNYIQTACGEIASDMTSESSGFLDDKWEKKIKKMKKAKVRDITGSLADMLYSDKDTLESLIGDRLCDLAGFETPQFYEVLKLFEKSGHTALKEAAIELSK